MKIRLLDCVRITFVDNTDKFFIIAPFNKPNKELLSKISSEGTHLGTVHDEFDLDVWAFNETYYGIIEINGSVKYLHDMIPVTLEQGSNYANLLSI